MVARITSDGGGRGQICGGLVGPTLRHRGERAALRLDEPRVGVGGVLAQRNPVKLRVVAEVQGLDD